MIDKLLLTAAFDTKISLRQTSATLLVHLYAAVHQSQPPWAVTHVVHDENVEQSTLAAPLTVEHLIFSLLL